MDDVTSRALVSDPEGPPARLALGAIGLPNASCPGRDRREHATWVGVGLGLSRGLGNGRRPASLPWPASESRVKFVARPAQEQARGYPTMCSIVCSPPIHRPARRHPRPRNPAACVCGGVGAAK
jgi:hypothetical protein